jgi:hypothetical protein
MIPFRIDQNAHILTTEYTRATSSIIGHQALDLYRTCLFAARGNLEIEEASHRWIILTLASLNDHPRLESFDTLYRSRLLKRLRAGYYTGRPIRRES